MKSTQGNEIYIKLKKDIISLKLEPGAQLSIKELISSLGVSRSPIRDAFLKLSNERLVDIIPQSGCRVTTIDVNRAEQERLIRKSVELEMIRRKMLVVDREFILQQKSNLMFQNNAIIENDLPKFFKLDEEFHKRLFESSGLLYTWEIIENNTCSSYQRVRVLSMRVSGVANNILEQHDGMRRVCESGDFDKLFEIDKVHLSKINEEFPYLFEKFPTYFTQK
ncbi:MAG: GntR family transcriptional regulator [Spirochaetaceae bacterium]|nr:GntR family transcriptional regulator [Spirochaetaceae bacterium]